MKNYYYPPKFENLPDVGIDEEFSDVEFAAIEEARLDNLELIDLSKTSPIIYYHGHHSNPCIVGEIKICKPIEGTDQFNCTVIAITNNMIYKEYGDALTDITKLWDAQVQVESYGNDRYDTDYNECIHIPISIGEHTTLVNKILKQILLDNKVDFVTTSKSCANKIENQDFFINYLGMEKEKMTQLEFEFMKNMPPVTSLLPDYEAIGEELGILLNEKQAAYGNAFGKMQDVMNVFYPTGIKTHQYQDVLTLVRILDKMFRIANLPENGNDLMNEDPWKDIAGYAMLALSKVNDKKYQD